MFPEIDKDIGYMRNMFCFLQRKYSIYLRMAVNPDSHKMRSGDPCPPPAATSRARCGLAKEYARNFTGSVGGSNLILGLFRNLGVLGSLRSSA